MTQVLFPTIDLRATGENIIRLRKANGFTVRELQHYFGFEEPQAIYKWQQGKCLPSVDNLYALSRLFGVSMNEILVQSQLNLTKNGQSNDCPLNFLLAKENTHRHTKSQSFQSFLRAFRTQALQKSTVINSFICIIFLDETAGSLANISLANVE